MSTEPLAAVLHDPKAVDSYIEKLQRYNPKCEMMKLWFMNLEDCSAALGVSSLSAHYNTMIDTGREIPVDSCIYRCEQDLRVRWGEWIESNPLTFRAPDKRDGLMVLLETHRRMANSHARKAHPPKPKSVETSLMYHTTSPVVRQMVLLKKKNNLSQVSRSQYCLSGVCVLLCVAAVFTDGVSDGYPTRGTLYHFFCLCALYVVLHIALTLGLEQQGQLNQIWEANRGYRPPDSLMMYLPLCMAICPHLCSSVLHFGRGVDTKPPVDDMMLIVFGLWILYAWCYHQIVVPRRWYTWVSVLALRSILWGCEYIIPDQISVSSSRLQYQLIQLGFPHGNTLYLLSGVVRYCIASRFMMHRGVHQWSKYTSIVVCLFLLTCPYFIYPDLTVPRTPVTSGGAKEPRRQHTSDEQCNTTAVDGMLATLMGSKEPCQQHASDEYCNMTAAGGVLATFMGKAYTVDDEYPCILNNPEECRCADTTVCDRIVFRRDNEECIKVYFHPFGVRDTMVLR